MRHDDHPTVWSSDDGDLRKSKPQPAARKSIPASQQIVYLHRESKGRGGKTVTLVKNLELSEEDMKALVKILKQTCGSGGTIKNGIIEIQGEHREKIAVALEKQGYKVKLAGG
jgi:translation initiation factor 1